VAFLGCMRAGVVPVPAYPPHPAKLAQQATTLANLTRDAGASLILTDASYIWVARTVRLRAVFGGAHGVDWPIAARWRVTDSPTSTFTRTASPPISPLPAAALNSMASTTTDTTTVAFLQYTSGSTSAPKGVMITHACLQHNVALIRRSLDLRLDDCEGSFLPQYHDMGLVGGYLAVLGVLPPNALLRSSAVRPHSLGFGF